MSSDLTKTVIAYKELFARSNLSNVAHMYKVANNLYDALIQQYEYCEEIGNYKQQARICQMIDEEVLKKLDTAIIKTKSNELANQMLSLRKLFFALSARRNLKNFALYIEQYKNKKVWDKTMKTVESIFYYLDAFSIKEKFNLMRASLMPSMGKSYIANLFCAQSMGNNPNVQILRITYADDLCITTTMQTRSIIDSQAFREIYPRYASVPEVKIFKSATKYQICMCDCEDEYNLFATTREGQSTGKRAHILVIDDLLKDDSESYNISLHKKLVDRYDSTWSSRADDDKLKVLLLGTMWANTDLLNILYDRACQEENLIPSKKFKYVELSPTGQAVFIGVPALDENGESTCPLRYSTANLQKKKKNMSKFLWQCVYQQNPIAPEGLEFDYSLLEQYEEKPLGLGSESRYASLDPARRGKNYVSMPILYKHKEKYYLVDFLYKKKSMKELYDVIVDKIIEHRLNALVVENNTDTSLKMVLEEKLHMKGYYGCTIIETYSVQNKEQRIKDHQGDVRGIIVYPKKGTVSLNSDLGVAMESIVSYSFDYPNKFDDAIDSIVLFIMHFVNYGMKIPKVGTFNRKYLGI